MFNWLKQNSLMQSFIYLTPGLGEMPKKMSDWDLLILPNLKKVPFDLETKIMDDFYELELETGEAISPLIYSKNDWNKNILQLPYL